MTSALGGGGSPKDLQQGQFSFGPSQFDLGQDYAALGDNLTALVNRYAQLGLGGSTMQGQDLSGTELATQAMIGNQQTTSVQDAATNPALQPATTTPNIGAGSAGATAGLLGAGVNPGAGASPNTGLGGKVG